ncbi:MAG: hypothetical protein WKF97_19860 [Chitinophagaceae bacterium]
MKILITFFSLLIVYDAVSFGQPNIAVRFIKTGNTYREANQYKESERLLLLGLNSVRQQNNISLTDRYWEAVACENLGLLFRDMDDSLQAIRYFDTASKIYQQLKHEGSKLALDQLRESIRKRSEGFAGIDIGSTGVKLSIIQVTLGREGRYIYNTTKDSAINSNFADLNTSAFEATKNAIREYLTIISNRKITPDRIFIAFSSGVLQAVLNRRLSTDSISKVFVETARTIIPSYKHPIEFLSPDMEAKFTNIGIVLPKLKEKSVSIDIGGGSTKGGYYNSSGDFESFSLPFGSRFMSITREDNILPEDIKAELTLFSQKPGIQNKKEVFFLGGIVWAMVNLLHPEKALSDYVEFTYHDVVNFQKFTSGDYVRLIYYTQNKVDKITDRETSDKAKKNLIDVQNAFTAENLRRGALLFAGIMNELNIPTLKKRYYFLTKGGHIAWVTGYVVSNISNKYRTATE